MSSAVHLQSVYYFFAKRIRNYQERKKIKDNNENCARTPFRQRRKLTKTKDRLIKLTLYQMAIHYLCNSTRRRRAISIGVVLLLQTLRRFIRIMTKGSGGRYYYKQGCVDRSYSVPSKHEHNKYGKSLIGTSSDVYRSASAHD